MEASPDLKDRILRAARADLEAEPTAPVPISTPAPPVPTSLADVREDRSMWSARLSWAVAAVMALALIGSLIWNMSLRNQLDERPETLVFTIIGSDEAVGVQGEVLVIGDDGETILKLSGLPELERGQVYQVWLIQGETPVPNVTFVGDTTGLASVGVVGSAVGSDFLGITIEPTGGSLTPSSQPIMLSDLTTQS